MLKDLTISKKQMSLYERLSQDKRIKIHHCCSCKLSIVHTRWRR